MRPDHRVVLGDRQRVRARVAPFGVGVGEITQNVRIRDTEFIGVLSVILDGDQFGKVRNIGPYLFVVS